MCVNFQTSPCGYEAATCTDAAGNAIPSPLNVWIQTGSYVSSTWSSYYRTDPSPVAISWSHSPRFSHLLPVLSMLSQKHLKTCDRSSCRCSYSWPPSLPPLEKPSHVRIYFMSRLLQTFRWYIPWFPALSLDPLLVWNYGAMGVIALVGGILFWLSVRKLDADEDRLNNLADGHFRAEGWFEVDLKHLPYNFFLSYWSSLYSVTLSSDMHVRFSRCPTSYGNHG